MKRIEPIEFPQNDIAIIQATKPLFDWSAKNFLLVADKLNALISAHNEAVEPKATLQDGIDELVLRNKKYREVLEEIIKEIESLKYTETINNKWLLNIAKSALNPTPPDKTEYCVTCGKNYDFCNCKMGKVDKE